MNNAEAQHVLRHGTLPTRRARNGQRRSAGISVAAYERATAECIAMLRREIRDELVGPLEERIKALEARPAGVKYAGVFEQGKRYDEGDLATDAGALWIALRSTFTKPGTDADEWRLIVKRGEEPRFPTQQRHRSSNR